MTTTQPHLGELVRQARHTAGLTQEQFAVRASITPKTLRAIERGMEPGRLQQRTLRGLAGALGVDVDELVHVADATPASPGRAEKHDSPDPRPLPGVIERAGATGG